MVHTKDLEKLFALSIASSYIKEEKPVSLMVVSDRPESGKTEMASKFFGKKGIAVVSDLTAYGFWRDFKEVLETGELRHIIIPEFLAPTSRGADTVGSFIALLQMLIEEGLTEIHTGFLHPIRFNHPVVVGAIVCMPRDAFQANRTGWITSGFLSRFVLATYKYNDASVESIFESIVSRKYRKSSPASIDLSRYEPVPIGIPRPVAEACRVLSDDIVADERARGGCYGFRELKHLMRLTASNVVLDRAMNKSKRSTATMKDFDEIVSLSYLINEQFNAVMPNKEDE